MIAAADWTSSHMPTAEPISARPHERNPWLAVAAPVAVFIVAMVAAWYRMPATVRNTWWAEDARIFSQRALDPSSLPWSVFTSYDGYVHVLPQSVAWVLWYAIPIPIDLMAQAFTAAACAVAAAVAALIFILTGQWGLNLPGRLLLAFTTVLVPGLSYELIGNIANAHWFLLWLAPFLFLARPARWWSSVLLGILSFVVLTSEVQAVLFTPLLLWRVTDRRRWPLIVGAGAGAAIQAIAVLGGGRKTWGTGLPSVLSILDGYAMQVPLLGLSGTGQAASVIVAYSGWAAAYAAIIPFVLCAAWWAWRARGRALLAGGILVASLAIWTAGYALNQSSAFDFATADRGTLLSGIPLLRYAIVPLMLLFAYVGLAVGRQKLSRATFHRAVAGALVVLCLAIFAVNYRVEVPSLRTVGPTWSEGLSDAREECEESPGDEFVEIPIAPVQYWTFEIQCERIAR
ncbi:hypothetical protein R8Z57_11430 [Microbacterium sp. M3]|uniref:Integral membrane protein n=1 Tax=Microbacterium arthrosphaerae TaxID=792652 RepID=A0ABU4H3S6_9MICO|nr:MULTISPECIES: hypothetical protein [Microbacterium]MDW4573382.1 hypothetical protein [Microbacterium arthrosphaerae]MDW7607237.1 hypothetical protein [Microbacterium sp. M3]